MENGNRSEPEVKRPASRAERVLSILSLGCIVLGAIAGPLGFVLFMLGLLLGLIVVEMTCARLHLRISAELSFLLVPAIIAMFAVVLFPLFANMRGLARQSTCIASMRMIGAAMEGYCQNWDGKLPPGDRWNDLILKDRMRGFHDFCPEAPGDLPSYAMNGRLGGKRLKGLPGDTVLLFECAPGRNRSGGPELLPRLEMHSGGSNVLFADGTAKCVRHAQIRKLRWRP